VTNFNFWAFGGFHLALLQFATPDHISIFGKLRGEGGVFIWDITSIITASP